jgi:CRISPR-associated endonuclease/helicase Cas3
MTTLSWPDWLEEIIWAKSAEKGQAGHPESLARHTWGVLQKLAEAVRLRPDLPARIGFAGLWNCLFWACFLHDFGKAARGFQERLRGGERWPHRHEVLSLAFVDWVANALSAEECMWVAAAVVSHHKDADEIQRLYIDPLDLDEDPLIDRLAEISDEAKLGLWRWLKECPACWIEALGLHDKGIRLPSLPEGPEAIRQVCEQGVARTRYWLRTYRQFLRTLNQTDQRTLITGTLALRGHLCCADHMASAHTGKAPVPLLSRPADLLARLGIEAESLYAHQITCAETSGSAVLVAPTGSGKTEAALLWACAQASKIPVPRLFYTLPYQASMNAMYDRLRARAFPGQVGLEHSRSTLALYRRWLQEDYTPRRAAMEARSANNLAHLNYFPVRVLSPYQILKASYRLRGYEELLSDLFEATFIFDEIHAYEAERLAIILATVRYLREQLGAMFLVMSATLPGLLQARLAHALGTCASVQAAPDLFAQFRRHELHILEGDLLADRYLQQIAQVAAHGCSVLVCCNTVSRAQQVYDELCGRLPDCVHLLLLHGGFNGKDRLEKENAVRVATGSQSTERRPIVLVATQVVEVSLDIDLDVIYTDPAPLEALIQRFGRINRRRLKESAPVNVLTEPNDGQGVYEEDLVQATLAVLAKNSGCLIDEEAISDWLDAVYQGPIAERWNRAYEVTYNEFEAACLRTLRAFNSDRNLEEIFYRAFDGVDVLPVCLECKYYRLMEAGEPLEASQLLVSIRWGRYCKLRREGRVREGREAGSPRVVDAEYSSELGLLVR